ncbi:hypothetical protein GIY30_12430 [Gordonia sp. HNM0687]|uniref:Transmembrane protein n=1 Tax=Gordonia mangrovi TaxID=2665643 RepID=A0A6L7GSR1_9ACTN|nr:hypothetical protein [Gordonia mangrovi]MXP22151.1 hypothetical protein [Gordonia mangrovi]UVF77940.1 hypothetical protein NWF22_22310 [Gordonia mangrovi]
MTEDPSATPADRAGRPDVEKRWDDPGAFRKAALYVAGVVVLAAVAVAAFLATGRDSMGWALAPPAVLLLGGVAALVIAYRVYRRGGTWPIWHGAAWFLFALMLLALGFPLTLA